MKLSTLCDGRGLHFVLLPRKGPLPPLPLLTRCQPSFLAILMERYSGSTGVDLRFPETSHCTNPTLSLKTCHCSSGSIISTNTIPTCFPIQCLCITYLDIGIFCLYWHKNSASVRRLCPAIVPARLLVPLPQLLVSSLLNWIPAEVPRTLCY